MDLDARLAELSKDVLSGKYERFLSKPPKFYKPKPSGTQRTITVLPIQDALGKRRPFHQRGLLNLIAVGAWRRTGVPIRSNIP